MALGILALVSGGIFAMMSATMQVTSETETRQERARKTEALGEFLRKGFANLPLKCRISLRGSTQRGGNLQELLIENAPNAFAWGKRHGHFGPVSLTPVPRSDGLLDLRVIKINPKPTTVAEAAEWIRLAGNFRLVEWSVMDPSGQWLDNWTGEQLPRLVRMRWQLQGDDSITERVFDIPASRLKFVEKKKPDEKT